MDTTIESRLITTERELASTRAELLQLRELVGKLMQGETHLDEQDNDVPEPPQDEPAPTEDDLIAAAVIDLGDQIGDTVKDQMLRHVIATGTIISNDSAHFALHIIEHGAQRFRRYNLSTKDSIVIVAERIVSTLTQELSSEIAARSNSGDDIRKVAGDLFRERQIIWRKTHPLMLKDALRESS